MKDKMWTMRNGKEIKIEDMTDSHLINTIKMVERVCLKRYNKLLSSGYSILSLLTGEQAVFDVENAIEFLEEDGVEYPDVYYDLIEEADKRKLNLGS